MNTEEEKYRKYRISCHFDQWHPCYGFIPIVMILFNSLKKGICDQHRYSVFKLPTADTFAGIGKLC